MKCETIRSGSECVFMANKGCSYKYGTCYEIIEKCQGCQRSSKFSTGLFCTAYPEPKIKWGNGTCNLATHITSIKSKSKIKVNPLKASKRAVR